MRPTIPKEEFGIRQKKLQELMRQHGIDMIAAYADDRYVYGQAYTRWLCNYQPQFEPACALLPAKGDMLMITGAESEAFVPVASYCENTKVVDDFLHPDEEYPYVTTHKFDSVLNDIEDSIGKKVGKIGFAGLSDMPHTIYEMFRRRFDMEAAVDATPLFTQLRMVKSENEIAVIKYAYKVGQAGMQAALDSIKEGVCERDVAAEAEYAMRKMGYEGLGIEMMVAFGKTHTRPILSRTTFRTLKKGDLVSMTIAPRYEGYHGPLARGFVFGAEDKTIENALETARYAMDEASKALTPGNDGTAADRISRQIMRDADLEQYYAYTGIHSVGVTEFEPPIMGSGVKVNVEKNMVLSVDIPIFLAPWGGLRIENGFLVTDGGPEKLITLDTLIKK